MKKLGFILLIITVLSSLSVVVAKAQSDNFGDIDSSINAILEVFDEDEFSNVIDSLNSFFDNDKNLKDRILQFISGDIDLSFTNVLSYFTSGSFSLINPIIEIMCYVLFIGILCTTINKINSKNNDNSEKNIIYLICFSLIVLLSGKVVSIVFKTAKNAILEMNEIISLTFPIMLTLSEFSGGFGVNLFKPALSFLSVIVSNLSLSAFIPILYSCSICVIIGNLSNTIKLDSLKKSLLSLVKWALGIATISFTIFITAQGLVNGQYNGLYFKVLKYTTGSIIPIVGNFISGGLDAILSSAVLVKNSFGLIVVIYVFLKVGGAGFSILITSFIIKFLVSVCEPIIDEKFVKFSNGLAEVFSSLSAVIFLSGFAYVLVCFSIINSTSLII